METVNLSELEAYAGKAVEVCIHGRPDEDKPPLVKRKISSVSLCPDGTHARIYFDKHFFLAVPLTSSVEQTEQEWTAYDKATKLYYKLKESKA